MRFSANLGFLFTEFTLPDGIHAAAEAGFDAVECHFPYDEPVDEVLSALELNGLPMLGLNTVMGSAPIGGSGLSALPGYENEARRAIDQALDYGASIRAAQVHVMAGKGEGSACWKTFKENLTYASDQAKQRKMNIVIEPLNHRDMPGYFLHNMEQAVEIVESVGASNLKIMFDCYHIQIIQGDLVARFERYRDYIGHIQFAAVPGRAEPDQGEINYPWLLRRFQDLGYEGYFGAEYRPKAATADSLGWLSEFRNRV